MMGIIGKRIVLIHLKPPGLRWWLECPNEPTTPTLTNHVPIVKFMGMMKIVISPYIWNYDKANHNQPMLRKNEGKCAINKGSTTKPTPSQPNTMLGGSNDEHGNKVKSNIGLILSKVAKWKNSLFFNSNVNRIYSNGVEFLGPLTTTRWCWILWKITCFKQSMETMLSFQVQLKYFLKFHQW